MKWVVLFLSILVFNLVAIFSRKRLKISEIISTILFGLFLSLLVDVYASFRYKAWGFFEVEKAEFTVIFIVLGIYPAATALIINWFPYNSSKWKKFFYLLGWSVFSTAYEWLTLKVNILWHINWNLFYSFLLYPFIYYMLIIYVKINGWIKQRLG